MAAVEELLALAVHRSNSPIRTTAHVSRILARFCAKPGNLATETENPVRLRSYAELINTRRLSIER